MKILQLGKFYPIRGGVEKVMYDLILGLSKEKKINDMLCASTEDYPAGAIELSPYSSIMVTPTKWKIASTMLAPAMIKRLRQIARYYDIIHIHHPDPMAALALFLSGYKGKVVLHWHADIVKQRVLLRLYSPLQHWLIKRADVIVGTSPIYVDESPFLKKVKHKLDYIPIGVLPVSAGEQRVLAIKERYRGKHLIFSLGRLVDYKGYAYLIRAAQYLDASYQINIGGKGPLYDDLSALILELGVADRVSLLGFLSDEDAAAHYAASDIFCLSSIWKTEAFAIVQIEAMSCGKPIVSTHIPGSGVSWVNQHDVSGLVVERKNPEALAQACKKIATNPVLKRRLAEGSRKRYEDYFTRDRMVEKSLTIYKDIIMEKRKTMKMNKLTVLIWLTSVLLLNACMVPKKVVYVKDMVPDSAYLAIRAPALHLQKNDRIQIVVTASAPELAAPFNGGVGNFKVGDDGNVSTVVDRTNGGYLVDEQGEIDFPILGKLRVEGQTLEQVRELVRIALISKEYISNPSVKVELLNLKISVIGAVGGQQVLQVPEARITLLEAITRAGGLSVVADPQSVLVIREEHGERKKYVNDIESKTIFDSPTYYLRQNDIVYVEPKTAVMTPREQLTRQYISFGMSLISIGLSVFALFKL